MITIQLSKNNFQGFSTVSPESLISPHAKDALKNFLKHGEFGRTEIGIEDEVSKSIKIEFH